MENFIILFLQLYRGHKDMPLFTQAHSLVEAFGDF